MIVVPRFRKNGEWVLGGAAKIGPFATHHGAWPAVAVARHSSLARGPSRHLKNNDFFSPKSETAHWLSRHIVIAWVARPRSIAHFIHSTQAQYLNETDRKNALQQVRQGRDQLFDQVLVLSFVGLAKPRINLGTCTKEHTYLSRTRRK